VSGAIISSTQSPTHSGPEGSSAFRMGTCVLTQVSGNPGTSFVLAMAVALC